MLLCSCLQDEEQSPTGRQASQPAGVYVSSEQVNLLKKRVDAANPLAHCSRIHLVCSCMCHLQSQWLNLKASMLDGKPVIFAVAIVGTATVVLCVPYTASVLFGCAWYQQGSDG